LEIFDNGFIRYVGLQFAQRKGERRAVISRDAVENPIAAFLRADYFALRDDYENYKAPDGKIWHITDVSTTYSSLRVGRLSFAPERLKKLEDEIDRVANTQQWIGSPLLNVPAPKTPVAQERLWVSALRLFLRFTSLANILS